MATYKYQHPFRDKWAFGCNFGVKGSWACGFHSGQDYWSYSQGGDRKVYPVCEGTVTRVRYGDKSYGNYLWVKHPDGYLSLYAHLAAVYVSEGQSVTKNTVIGKEGTTGNSTGIHLHVEIHKGNYCYPASINPKTFINERMVENLTEKETIAVIKNQFPALFDNRFPGAFDKRYQASNPFYANLKDIPSYWQADVEQLRRIGAIQGDGANEVGMYQDALKGIIAAWRAIKQDRPIYHRFDDLPDWGKEPVQQLLDAGLLQGAGDGVLDLSYDTLRGVVLAMRYTDDLKTANKE